MNSAHAFAFATGGSYTDEQMQRNSAFVNQTASMFQGAGSWMATQASKLLTGFNEFMDSRAWEMSKRLFGKNTGDHVGRFDIGYLGSVSGIQGAEGFMRDYAMAHPVLQQAYLDGDISGYGGEFSALCFGIGEANIFHRRAMNGLLNLETVDDKARLRHTHYQESLGGKLSFRERDNLQMTYRAIDHHLANDLLNVLTDPRGMKTGSTEPAEPPEEPSVLTMRF